MHKEKALCKHNIGEAYLKVNHGIEGDAHAGNWHRQVSLLAAESVEKVQKSLDFELKKRGFCREYSYGRYRALYASCGNEA